MLGTILDWSIRGSLWAVGKTYNGVTYLIYGTPKNPLITRIETLENRLSPQNKSSPNVIYYWDHKYEYPDGNWVVICDGSLVCQTDSKTKALQHLAEKSDEEENKKCLLVCVGQENLMYEI